MTDSPEHTTARIIAAAKGVGCTMEMMRKRTKVGGGDAKGERFMSDTQGAD